ncbi:NAD(P)/FAD-dependent oxidoreductase [Ramlibacter rhizophilus]|uniref:NAD(P)/FAD-dependent oxidoreductase n=1 Tax=Ramlibacter rhizophilus TaxID=1781167 RepID=A0A4Z0C0F3_9BURK|nr:NAD(P)/FAD-dependent oxidoreductase [Ramlibacter rhizophilus]TFZ04284.1 NAD(P)/FAD-dependent oxidoreductase [Ramlibacter rhizophilus]
MSQSADLLDCLVVGAGPAGLTSAVYLARFRRRLRLVDAGESRVQWIPRTRNVLGFPDGIGGTALLARMREHAACYGIEPWAARVASLARDDEGIFEAAMEGSGAIVRARTVILCTGATDIPPDIEGLDAGLRCGNVRYCPVCDGFETQHQRVAVLGREEHGLREALFVAGFDNEVTWLSMGTRQDVDSAAGERLAACGVRVANGQPRRIACSPGEGIAVHMEDGASLNFDVLYPALGQRHASALATALGARAGEDGQLEVDAHQRTAVPGLWAAGDVAQGLNQINVAAGQAAIAATSVHNFLGQP